MSRKLAIMLAILSMALFLSVATAAESTAKRLSASFVPLSTTAAYLPNPEKGFAEWSGTDLVAGFDNGSVNAAYAAGTRLVYCTVQIGAYRGGAIAGSFLTALNTNLGAVRSAGMKCVMLIAYDVYGGSMNDDTAANIIAHTQQLAPVLRANADVIPYAKAGFIGQYGEWHDSLNSNTCGGSSNLGACAGGSLTTAQANKVAVRDAILAMYHPYTQVGFRYPDDHYTWSATPLSPATAFNGSIFSRSGMHNDGMLSSGPGGNDSGTWVAYTVGQSQATLQSYMDTHTNYTAYGGEISNDTSLPRTTCAEAVADFSRWHASYLKVMGGSNWTTAWTTEGCTNQLQNLIGYWLQLDSVSHQGTVNRSDSITVRVALRNLGWSRVFQPRKLQVSVCQVAAPNTCYSAQSTTSLRSLTPQAVASTTLSVPIKFPGSAVSGAYSVRLSVPDIWSSTLGIRAFNVRFANTDSGAQVWNDALGYITTGTTLTVN